MASNGVLELGFPPVTALLRVNNNPENSFSSRLAVRKLLQWVPEK
jgi:hypothetical protein